MRVHYFSILRFAALAAGISAAASCVKTENAPVTLTLPDEIAACLTELRAELADPAPIRACINIRRTGGSPLPCALQISLDQLCPGGQCSNTVSQWTAVCPTGAEAKLSEVNEGEILPADLELTNSASCPFPEQSLECNGSSVTMSSTGLCFARLDLELKSSEGSGALVPGPSTDNLKLSYSGFFGEELKSGKDPQMLCSALPIHEATGTSKNNVKVMLTVSGSAPGTVTSVPVGKLDCSTDRSPCSADVADGREFTLTAVPDPDAMKNGKLKGWVSCPGNTATDPAKCTSVVHAGSALQVAFGYGLTGEARTSSAGSMGSVTMQSTAGESYIAQCTTENNSGCAEHIFTALEPIKITATPGPGSSVVQWIGCMAGPGVSECNLTMDATRSVAVVFGSSVCGNGIVDGGEECDDGGLSAGDGCAADCKIEPGYRCDGVRSECIGFIASEQTITLDEGQAAGATFTVVMNAAPSGPVTLTVASSDESVAVVDTATLNFTPVDFMVPRTVTVTPVPNTIDGPEQASFTITIAPDTIAGPLGMVDPVLISGTVNDDDDPPAISIADVSHPEGNSGTTSFDFTVTLSHASAYDVSVAYQRQDGSATVADSDYSLAPGTLHFAPGQLQGVISASANGDVFREADETFHVALSNAMFATIAGTGVATGTIQNDDTLPVLSIGSPRVTEASGATVTFTVSLFPASGETITVNYATADGTAVQGEDYTPIPNGLLTFNPGDMSKTITVTILDDTYDEDDETFYVNLSMPSNAIVSPTSGVGVATIADDDPTPSVSIADPPSIAEGDSGSRTLNFTLTLTAASEKAVSVDCATSQVTATAGVDYVERSAATVSFARHALTATFPVTIIGDQSDEPNETFTVTCSAPNNVILTAPGTATGTIRDDDAAPTLSISCPTVTETDSGSTPAVCTVSVSVPSGRTISVDYQTADGTALAGSDYSTAMGTLNFAIGEASKTISVSVLGDVCDEADNETFTVNLSGAVNATIPAGSDQGTVTIADNDPLPSLSINSVTVTEADSTTVNASFTVSLSAQSCRAVSVGWSTANGTAAAPGDYVSVTGASLTIPAGSTSGALSVTVNGDTLREDNETFDVVLATPTNGVISGTGRGTGTINDNDPLPTLSIASPLAITEGDSGSANLRFLVTLTPASGQVVTVNYTTANGTAVAGQDYTTTSGSLSFPALSTLQSIDVPILGDLLDEDNETFTVTLSAPGNAVLATGGGNVATGTINDNDLLPALSINNNAVLESAGTLSFTVTLTPVSGRDVTFTYATASGTAISGTDFTAASGPLTIPAGATSATINVPLTADTLDEDDETFTMTLSAPGNATISGGTGTGTILDDDALPALSIANNSATETNAGVNTTLSFTVSLAPVSGRAVTVNYATAGGTAISGTDFTAASSSLTIPAGASSGTINVTILGDDLDEDDETFTLALSAPTNATISSGTGTGTILDNDALPVITIANNSVTETNSGTVNLPLTVTLTPVSGRAVSVNYLAGVVGDSAISGTDYTPTSGTLMIAAGATSGTINVPVVGDTLDEDDETFTLTLSAPSNATISGGGTAIGTINDNDPLPALSIANSSLTEPDTGTTTNMAFTVTLTPVSGRAVTVNYATAAGSATAGTDYTTTSATLTIPAGNTTGTINIPVVGDSTDENDETFTVTLSAPGNATITAGSGTGTGTINDNDPLPAFTIGNPTIAEVDTGFTSTLVYAVTLTPASGRAVSIDYATGAAGDTATAGTDYTTASGTLNFPAGATSGTINVTVTGDVLDEDDETVTMTLSNPGNATISDGIGSGTITDNDASPTLSVGNLTLGEPGGPLGTTASGNVVVTLSAASGRTVSAAWTTSDDTAVAGPTGDYTAASGTVTFAAGTTTQNISVTVRSDGVNEGAEDFFVNLSAPMNASIVDGQGVVTIPANTRLRADQWPEESARRVDEGGDKESRSPAISRDGEVVAFESDASNLVKDDTNGATDIFVYDRAREKLERLSVSSRGLEAKGASRKPAVSGDGRWVVFESDADDLVSGDGNGRTDIFLADRLTGTTERISQNEQDATDPNISMDGRYIVFRSGEDLFVHDRASRATRTFEGPDLSPALISEHGRFVVFRSGPEGRRLMLEDAEVIGARAPALLPLIARGAPAMTPDGRYIAVFGGSQISIYDRAAGAVAWSKSALACAGLSDDGRWLLFTAQSAEGELELRLGDRTRSELVHTGAILEDSPRISGDGRHVVFVREGAIYLSDRP